MDKHRDNYDIEKRLIDFAVIITDIVEKLPDSRLGTHISGQMIRSGTAPAAVYGEAQSAESRKDFIHKMKIALKELRESRIWLQIIARKQFIHEKAEIQSVLSECEELIRIFVKSIKTAESNLEKS